MTVQTEHVLQKLFSENSLDNIPVETLRQVVKDHPFFSLGHLLLAKKLQLVNDQEYEEQSERTSLYFQEPIWLQSIMQSGAPSDSAIHDRLKETQAPEVPSKVVEVTTEREEAILPVIEPLQAEHAEQSVEPDQRKVAPEEESSEPIFESYHTIDYFASQGIKISAELNPGDRLSQQLKSFTEWLKTLKRLPEAQAEAQLDEASQHNIQQIAEHSLDDKEVVTETMAEVLVKQNKPGEAIRIYEKLSLLNPSKRAYFAAKIEQLKVS